MDMLCLAASMAVHVTQHVSDRLQVHLEPRFSVYVWYMPGKYHVYVDLNDIHGIYMVYPWIYMVYHLMYIHGIYVVYRCISMYS
jgi:hypothetical protein